MCWICVIVKHIQDVLNVIVYVSVIASVSLYLHHCVHATVCIIMFVSLCLCHHVCVVVIVS